MKIDPQVRIATPEGDYWIGITLSPDLEERALQFALLKEFVIYKNALGFILVSELAEPNSVMGWVSAIMKKLAFYPSSIENHYHSSRPYGFNRNR